MMKITIALGSNLHQENNIKKAQELLRQHFPDIHFTKTVWTDPIGIKSDRYLNCIGIFTSHQSAEIIQEILKKTEAALGDSHENHKQGKVLIDIDLARYGERNIKDIIWLKDS